MKLLLFLGQGQTTPPAASYWMYASCTWLLQLRYGPSAHVAAVPPTGVGSPGSCCSSNGGRLLTDLLFLGREVVCSHSCCYLDRGRLSKAEALWPLVIFSWGYCSLDRSRKLTCLLLM